MKPSSLLLLVLLCLLPLAPALAQGNSGIKATVSFREDGTKCAIVADPEQRTEVETISDSKDRVLKKTTFLMDDQNARIAAIHYDQKGNIRYRESYTRDGANHVIESKLTGPDGTALGRRVFNYTGDKLTSTDDYDAQGQRLAARQPTTSPTGGTSTKRKK